ncbi:MAG TPA: hypothetical protein DCM62_09915 [Bacteroidales bacterium]|nr:hypothetical protein [Bacteroidales bacterium]
MKDFPFISGLVLMIGAAFLLPEPALHQGWFSLATLSNIGIFCLFFFYGLKIKREVFLQGLKNYKLHSLIQLTTFVGFPLLVLPFYPLIQSPMQQTLWLGILFLAALPSTLSMSVVMVSMAKGNISAAIFNASLSGILGIVITPLIMSVFLTSYAMAGEFGQIMFRLILVIVLPVCLGLMLQNFLKTIPEKYSKPMGFIDKGVVLLLVYQSFARSLESNVFSQTSFSDLIIVTVAMILLLGVVYFTLVAITQRMKLNKEDRTTALICGTQKSLIHGSVFANVLFGQTAGMGLLILPLLIYHTIQILFFSLIVKRLSAKN